MGRAALAADDMRGNARWRTERPRAPGASSFQSTCWSIAMNFDPTAQGPETLTGLGPGPAHWSTASFGLAADARPADNAALGEHLYLCRTSSGRLFSLRCSVEAAHAVLCGRVVTTLSVVVAMAGFALIVS